MSGIPPKFDWKKEGLKRTAGLNCAMRVHAHKRDEMKDIIAELSSAINILAHTQGILGCTTALDKGRGEVQGSNCATQRSRLRLVLSVVLL